MGPFHVSQAEVFGDSQGSPPIALDEPGGILCPPAMDYRIDFHAVVPDDVRPAIAAGLAPLTDAGFAVTVDPPHLTTDRGWCVGVEVPGRHRVFRTKATTAAEWAEFVAMIVRVAGLA
jgi:hypothetical protein